MPRPHPSRERGSGDFAQKPRSLLTFRQEFQTANENSILSLSRGNRTPGSRVATGCNSLDAQPRYCSSFQLTHMSREDHAQSSIAMSSQQWRPNVRRAFYSANNFASTVSFGMSASVNDSDRGCVVRIFVGPS